MTIENKRFIAKKRAPDQSVMFYGQFVVFDQKRCVWTPMAVFPLVARGYADMLNAGEKSISEFDWHLNDGKWDDWMGPDLKKFDL